MSTSFAELKERVSIEQVAQMLGIKLKPFGDKLRGPCPICRQGDDRTFVMTPAKGLFYCFKEAKGGDQLTLVSRLRNCSLPEAAAFIQGTLPHKGEAHNSPQPPAQEKEKRRGFDAEAYAKGLDPAHEALAPLGLAEATLREWKAGYSGSGVLRGKLALPVAQGDGTLVAYIGRSVNETPPILTFTKDFDPAQYIFGADRVKQGELTMVRDVLDVLKAWEGGVENCVAFLTESIAIPQFEVLISLMHEKRCESVSIF